MYEEYFLENSNKYEIKSKNIDADLKGYFSGKLIKDFNIKPVQFTIELTNKCNCNCPDCGMQANRVPFYNITGKKLERLLDEIQNFGIPSIAITGGEPFLMFDDFCNSFNMFNIDLIKIVSNGFWGNNPKYYFDKLKEIGFLNNKFFKPSIFISIGQQSVPLSTVANLFKYVNDNFKETDFNFGLINTRFPELSRSKLEDFVEIYESLYGTFPKKRFILTQSNYIYLNKENTCFKACDLITECDNRFTFSAGKFVSPKIFMTAKGDCYPCEIFQKPKEMFLGNLFNTSLFEIVKNYNENKYINFIKEYGTPMYKNILTKNMLENAFPSVCDACCYCVKQISDNNLLE